MTIILQDKGSIQGLARAEKVRHSSIQYWLKLYEIYGEHGLHSDNSFSISKSSKLPPLEIYFEALFNLQNLAIKTYLAERPKEKLLEDYFYIGADLENGISRERFHDVMNPLVTIASNNGFEFLY